MVYTFSLPVSLPVVLYFLHHVCLIQVTIALRFHLFPFRTEKLSSVTPMVLRNSGRVGSRRFLERSPCIGRCRGFLVLGLSFRTEKLSSFVCLALFCLLFFSFLCFACFLGVSRFLVGIILILVKYFSFFAFRLLYYIVSHHTHITSYIWQASPLMSFCSYVYKNAMHPFICPFHLSIFRFYSLFLFSLLSYCYLYGTKLVKNDIFYENGLLLFHSSCLISNGFS